MTAVIFNDSLLTFSSNYFYSLLLATYFPKLLWLFSISWAMRFSFRVNQFIADIYIWCRLRASLLEHFDRRNNAILSTCYEDILKKDPTCCHSLAKLVSMHQNGTSSIWKLRVYDLGETISLAFWLFLVKLNSFKLVFMLLLRTYSAYHPETLKQLLLFFWLQKIS